MNVYPPSTPPLSSAPPVERLTYTRRELSQALGIQMGTIAKLERRGTIVPVNIPGLTKTKLYRASDVHRLVETA